MPLPVKPRRLAAVAVTALIVCTPVVVATSPSMAASPHTILVAARTSKSIHKHDRIGRFSLPTHMTCGYKNRKLNGFSWANPPKVAMSKYWAAKGIPFQYVALYVRFFGKASGKWRSGPYLRFLAKASRGSGKPPLVTFAHAKALPTGGRFHGKVTAERVSLQVVWFKAGGDRSDIRDGYVTDAVRHYRNNVRSGVHADCPVEYFDPSWSKLAPTQGPPAATNTAAAEDLQDNTMILFGGRDAAGSSRNDTWNWDGRAWTQIHSALSPDPRQDAAMVYDTAAGNIVMFGGFDDAGAKLGDTWTWSSTGGWSHKATASAPSARDASGQFAYDAQSGQAVLFGGSDADGTILDDTWTWDGTSWRQQSPTQHPPAGAYSAMAYDSASNQLILFDAGQTWNWNGSDWTQLHPAHSPSRRARASITFDPRSHTLILFGGSRSGRVRGDMWSWNGSDWSRLHPRLSPSPRESPSLVYDYASANLFLYGGDDFGGTNGRAFTDAWTWAH